MGKTPRKPKIRFRPTLRKSNVGNVGHPSVKSNVGVIRIRRKNQ